MTIAPAGRAFDRSRPMRFIFLGSSAALPSASRDTTSILFSADDAVVLVDVGGSPVQKLRRVRIDPLTLSHVIVTHVHADHAYGLPALVQGLRLLGRRAPLTIVCRPEHVAALTTLLGVFGLWQRAGMFEVVMSPIDLAPGAETFAHGPLAVTTAPNDHGPMPNFAVRVERRDRAAAVVYSSDTRPSDAVVALASDADTLIHEATFVTADRERYGAHSSAADAGAAATRARVRRLILTHVDAEYHDAIDEVAAEARREFAGVVDVARELVPYEV
jgi:ribonuclease Z